MSLATGLAGRRRWTGFTILAVAAHHGIELAAGLGLPGEPLLSRRRAVCGWAAALSAHVAAASSAGRRWNPALAAANGSLQALAAQHYLSWPWRLLRGVPMLTQAEGLPAWWLPAYNAALLTAVAGATVGTLTEIPAGRRRWHLYGLATLPVQHPSARHHLRWLDADHGAARH
jgi:hypothetical protein